MAIHRIWFPSALVLLVMAIAALSAIEQEPVVELKEPGHYLPPVTVVAPLPQDHASIIRVNAEIKPRWSTALKAQVSGECIEIADKAQAGQQVEKGDLLLRIEDSTYQVEVQEAELALSEAKLALLQEQNKAAQAKRDWQRSGISEAPSTLVLNGPQLDLAEKAVGAAAARLLAASRNLANTQIRAPFSGQLTARHVSLGQAVMHGEELLHLIHQDKQEITVALSQAQWARLNDNWHAREVPMHNFSGIEIGQAKIKRGGGFLDPQTRQYQLFLEVDGTANPDILSGDYVELLLPGRLLANSLSVPESALTRNGYIWYVDDEERLRRFAASAIYTEGGKMLVDVPDKNTIGEHYPSSWRIATTPLASFLVGQKIDPVVEAAL